MAATPPTELQNHQESNQLAALLLYSNPIIKVKPLVIGTGKLFYLKGLYSTLMKKIPTLFEREDSGKHLAKDVLKSGCEWVLRGEGIATRKIDGTSCMVREGKLYKRRELRAGEALPPKFELSGTDTTTGKSIGWLPVEDVPEDRWHREAFMLAGIAPDGTYELVGPKIQGNPESFIEHTLVPHTATAQFVGIPRDFEGLKAWLSGKDIEGIVFHHPDGRMAKIKQRDFGLKRGTLEA